MLPENHACSPRNPFPGTVLFKEESNENYYCDDVEVDYKADDLARNLGVMVDEYGVVTGWDGESFL